MNDITSWNPKGLVISVIVVGILSLLLMVYISNFNTAIDTRQTDEGVTKSECIKLGGKWVAFKSYSGGSSSDFEYFCSK